MVFDGTGSYTGDGISSNLSFNGLTDCFRLQNDANLNIILGGACANAQGSSSCINLVNGNGNIVVGFDCEAAATGVTIGASPNNFGNRISIYGQGNGTDFILGAGAIGNVVDNVGVDCRTIQISVIDRGTNTQVVNPCKINATAEGQLTVAQIKAAGAAPTCVFTTGGGTGSSCSLGTGSTNLVGQIVARTGATPGSSGTITLSFAKPPFGTSGNACVYTASSVDGTWNARVGVQVSRRNPSGNVIAWDNDGVALAASTAYQINYWCGAL